jgi:magnesium transporter
MAKDIGLISARMRKDLASTDIASIRHGLEDVHPVDIAELISGLDPEAAWTVLEQLARDRAASVFAYLDTDVQVALAQSAQHHSRLGEIASRMGADDRADFYKELPPEQQQALLPLLAQAEREDIRSLASYEEGTAGALMTSAYASLPENLTAAQALEMLRAEAPSRETIYRAYVVDGERRLVGSLRLQDLILAQPRTGIGQIMDRNTLTVRIDDDQEEVARKIARYDILALPVLDADDRLVGIVTYDDAMDVLQEEATEDFHKSGTVQGLSQSIANAPIGMLYRARVMWLVVLVFGNIFSSAGIAAFEETIEAHVALVFFLPLLIGSGGNAGAQAATLMVRGMSTGDVALSDWGRLVGRELLVAVPLGLTMAAAVSLIGYLRGGIEIAWIVTLSMTLIVIIGSLIGMCLPFILSRSKLDPATASAPLVTSIADAVGVLIYFAIATLVLPPLAA